MLVLTRKHGESLVIDDNIVVKIVATGTGQVRIGIEAPSHIDIRRLELPKKVDTARGTPNREGKRRTAEKRE